MTGTLSPQSVPSSPSFAAHRSSRSSTHKPSLSIDLSSLPPLTQPSPPTNTLLITDLNDLHLFQPPSLASIREQIAAIAPLNSFSPLPSFRRIVCSFHNEDDAIRVRKLLDRESLLNRPVRTKIYFGEPTPILELNEAGTGIKHKLLEAPQVDKLFFISPPPSPPHGWVMRTEDPPNKEVHASDLAQALAALKTEQSGGAAAATFSNTNTYSSAPSSQMQTDPDTPMSLSSDKRTGSFPLSSRQRSRSSTLIYNPNEHGGSPNLPAVMVEDTSADPEDMDMDVEMSPIDMPGKSSSTPPFKTARPPVELMV
ncbi:putative calcineurin binding protein [Aspergillus stella-maris]|uniref:putative calcineurin binding protein n=1 Tax=Aspergillus stella-maris TaxID=1810926 RepID=UPI003CCCD2AA